MNVLIKIPKILYKHKKNYTIICSISNSNNCKNMSLVNVKQLIVNVINIIN